MSSGAADLAALLAAIGFLLLAGFQIALALGAPWGSAAWGGSHEGRLPPKLRIASVISAAFWILAAGVMLSRNVASPLSTYGPGLPWALFGLLALGALMNIASRSKWERYLMSPFAALLAVMCLLVALGS